MKKITEVDNYIDTAPSEQKEILTELRRLISEAVPYAIENFKWSRPVYSKKKDFCYLQSNKNDVNLGFTAFDRIDDPNGLLRGTGKSMRHVKIKSVEDIDAPLFIDMIAQAGVE